VAENRLCENVIKGLVGIAESGWLSSDEKFVTAGGMKLTDVLGRLASSCVCPSDDTDHDEKAMTTTRDVFEREMIYYQPTHGMSSTRKAMAKYLHRLLLSSSSSSTLKQSSSFISDNIVLGAGCNAVLENLCMVLTDPGEAVLIPTPYYAAFEFDLAARAGCHIVPVTASTTPLSCGDPNMPEFYYPSSSSLEDAYNRAMDETGRPPRVLLISHPNNPLGICYPPHVVQECIDWCREREVHLISDEIYAGSVYREETAGGGPTFISAMALGGAKDTAVDRPGIGLGPYIHLVYALSKDFALSGLRVGVVYTENDEILLPLQKLNDLCQISSQTQLLVERMLHANAVMVIDDKAKRNGGYDTSQKFKDVYLKANCNNIRARYDTLHSYLDDIGVPYLHADSGLFVWMDLREFLPSGTDVSNESMERSERQLYLTLMNKYGLLFTPGMSMRNEHAGFFRFVFTAAIEEEFELGLIRLRRFVMDMRRRQDVN
jgi:aspartate/methionine/tyrosine aminotransferase